MEIVYGLIAFIGFSAAFAIGKTNDRIDMAFREIERLRHQLRLDQYTDDDV